ncbi:hypothetical protein [Sulfitobacter pontiacus]|uniref:hypothetical protein n=1 Tax=Sulfitobacter pontiacus TaxID=60137 RepID=UPI0030EBF0FE
MHHREVQLPRPSERLEHAAIGQQHRHTAKRAKYCVGVQTCSRLQNLCLSRSRFCVPFVTRTSIVAGHINSESYFKYLIIPCILLASACAKEADKIPAADIGPNPYMSASCSQLAEAELQLDQNLETLTAAQKSAASGDAVGVILLGLPLSSMSGNDKETDIAITKGKIQAVQSAQVRRKCK